MSRQVMTRDDNAGQDKTRQDNLDANIFMMLLPNFTIAFYMLCHQLHVWAWHLKSQSEIGQQHHEDVVVQGQDKTRQYKTRQVKSRQDKTRQDKTTTLTDNTNKLTDNICRMNKYR